jgi:hypothetical protein
MVQSLGFMSTVKIICDVQELRDRGMKNELVLWISQWWSMTKECHIDHI